MPPGRQPKTATPPSLHKRAACLKILPGIFPLWVGCKANAPRNSWDETEQKNKTQDVLTAEEPLDTAHFALKTILLSCGLQAGRFLLPRLVQIQPHTAWVSRP